MSRTLSFRLGSGLVRLGKTLGHWDPTLNVHRNLGSKSTPSDAHALPDPSVVVSALPSYKYDNGRDNVRTDQEDTLKHNLNITSRTGHNEDAAKEKEGSCHVKKPFPTEVLPEVEVDPNEHDIPDHINKIRTGPVSALPWVPEEVLFKYGSSYKLPPGFINRGSFGSVFLVRHQSRGDLAALKIVKIKKGDSNILVQEIAALMRIRGRGNRFVLRQPLGVGDVIWTSDSGHLHLLFDLYIGDLYGFSGRPEVIDERFLGLVLTELHSGLAHLHRLGFIHKDLKPDNVLIDRDGHCVIADLGGCDIYPGISPMDPVSKDSPGVITPEFTAPELYQWDETKQITYTQALDLWSLGVTLCELITRTLPKQLVWPDEDDGQHVYSLQALGLEPDNIYKTLKSFACPDGIIEVVMELCHMNPRKRLDIKGLDRRIHEWGWNIPLGHYAPFPIDRNKSAVVLPKALRFFNSDTMEQAEDTADAIAEFDRALSNQGLSVPKLDGFLPDHAKVPPMDKKVNHHLRSSL